MCTPIRKNSKDFFRFFEEMELKEELECTGVILQNSVTDVDKKVANSIFDFIYLKFPNKKTSLTIYDKAHLICRTISVSAFLHFKGDIYVEIDNKWFKFKPENPFFGIRKVYQISLSDYNIKFHDSETITFPITYGTDVIFFSEIEVFDDIDNDMKDVLSSHLANKDFIYFKLKISGDKVKIENITERTIE